MAYNVFGNPVTRRTLEGMPEYAGKEIRPIDIAHVAFNSMNVERKNVEAQKYVDNLKEDYGNGVSTKCLFYNATGDSVELHGAQDWHGHLYKEPIPVTIQSGQWGGFLHVHPSLLMVGSAGGVVYRGTNNDRANCDFMCSWSNPYLGGAVRAYAEINEVGHFVGSVWDSLYGTSENAGKSTTAVWNGFKSTVTVGEGTTVTYVAILTLRDAENTTPPE